MATDDGHERVLDLPDDGSRQKEVYARFGLAVYFAQVFETGLVNLLVIGSAHRKRSEDPLTVVDIDQMFAEHFSQTSGRLAKRIDEFVSDPEQVNLIKTAVQERNRLIHHFFRDHDLDFMSNSGMQAMLDDADGVRVLLGSADAATSAVCHQFLDAAGVDEDCRQAEFDLLVAKARQADEPSN